MNGKRARAVKRSYGVKHVHQAALPRGGERAFPRWIGGWIEDVWKRVQSSV
jgi:hypothetical protein